MVMKTKYISAAALYPSNENQGSFLNYLLSCFLEMCIPNVIETGRNSLVTSIIQIILSQVQPTQTKQTSGNNQNTSGHLENNGERVKVGDCN